MEQKLTKQELAIAARRELARRELEVRKIREDEVYFFENYVYIENKSSSDPSQRSILFKMFPEQKRVLKEINENKLNIIIKARQLGMTWMAVAHGLHQSIKTPQYTTVILSQTESYMKEAIDRFDYILNRLPKWYCREFNKENSQNNSMFLYEKKSDEITLYHPAKEDGTREMSSIKGLVSTEKAGRSITADLLLFDEWAYHENAAEVFAAAYPTINRPDSGHFIGISTNKRSSFFEEIVLDCMDENRRGFNLIFLSCFTDTRRTQEWLEQTKAALPNSWQIEYPVVLTDALSAGLLTAFPEFDPSIHVIEPFEIPDHWIKWASCDSGYRDPFAWYKYAISEDGTIYVYYEYTRDKYKDPIVNYKDQAEKFVRDCTIDITEKTKQEINDLHLGFNTDNVRKYQKENLQYIVFGLDAFNRDSSKGTGLTLLDFYKQGGLSYPTVRATTNRELRKSAVHEFLKPEYDENLGKKVAKVQIFNTCKYLIKFIPQLVVEDDNPNVVADNSKIDNCYDSFCYGLLASPRNNSKEIKPPDSDIAKYKQQKIKKMKKQKRKGILN